MAAVVIERGAQILSGLLLLLTLGELVEIVVELVVGDGLIGAHLAVELLDHGLVAGHFAHKKQAIYGRLRVVQVKGVGGCAGV